jgi:hypothetical protein
MDFFTYVSAVVSAAFRPSVDTTQFVIFIAIIATESLVIFAPARFKPAFQNLSTKLSTNRVALIVLIGVIGTRLLLAPYWVWRDEHQARLLAEATNNGSVAQYQKHLAMKSLIATAIGQGEDLTKDWATKDADAFLKDTNQWTNRVGYLVADAYGDGEASLFMSDAGYVSYSDGKKQTDLDNWIIHRLERLDDLVKRVDTLPVQSNFDPTNYHWKELER